MKGKRLLSFLLAASLIALGGCNKGEGVPTPTPSIPIPSATPAPLPIATPFALPYDPTDSLSPYATGSSTNLVLAPLLYEGLYTLDATFTPQPLLARSGEMEEGGLVWHFTLESGVVFSDGTPLTAALAAACLTAAGGKDSPYAPRLEGVKSVQASGDMTLTITLTTPNSLLPALLDIPLALVKTDTILGTGPYRLEESTLVSRTDWWQNANRPLATIPLHPVTDTDSLIYAFDASDVGLVTADLTGPNALGYSGNYQTWDHPTSTMLYLGFRTTAGTCRTPAIRQAISQSLDRTTIVGKLLAGHGASATLPLSPRTPRYDSTAAAQLDWTATAAADTLTQAGYALGTDGLRRNGRYPLAVKLVVNTENSFKVAVAQHIADGLTALGFTVTLAKLPWKDYTATLTTGKFDLYLGECKMTADFNPSALLTARGTLNYGGFSNAALTDALLLAQATGQWAEFNTQFIAQSPIAVICFKNQSVLTQWGRISGLAPVQGNVFSGLSSWAIS